MVSRGIAIPLFLACLLALHARDASAVSFESSQGKRDLIGRRKLETLSLKDVEIRPFGVIATTPDFSSPPSTTGTSA